MRYRLVAGVLGLAMCLTGCSSEPEAAGSDPQRGASLSGPSETAAEASGQALIPASLRVALPATKAAPTIGDIVIDLADAVDAPSVDQAPVKAGLLLAQLNSFSPEGPSEVLHPGQPYLLTRRGDWRGFDLARYGLGDPVYSELSMAISRDGRDVVFADPSGLVTVDLDDNTFRRFDLPVREAIGLEWSPDASTLFLKDRHPHRRPCGPRGCSLDVSTGYLASTPFSLFSSTRGDAGAVFEVRPATGRDPVQIVTHRQGTVPSVVPVEYLTAVSTAGGPAAARFVAYAQCTRQRAVRHAGVVVVDPASGDVVSMLENGGRPACRLGAERWLDDDRLLVGDWIAGDLWLWDVTRNHVRQIAVGRTAGVNVSIASKVMARRFSR